MSNRTLFEVNHDHSHKIERDKEGFADALGRYLASGSDESAEALDHYGVRVFAMRHHSDAYDLKWGPYRITNTDWSKVCED